MIAPLDRLARCLNRLPGVGRRSGERMALGLVGNRENLARELIAALEEVAATVRLCSRCGAVTTSDRDPCGICTDSTRDAAMLCVVEEPSDVMAIEASGAMRGRYHVLGGRLSPMRGKGPWDLALQRLLERLDAEGYREVVLALGTDMDSDATSHFIFELLKGRSVNVTRLAVGLPTGSGIAYSYPVTLSRAIRGRQPMDREP